MKRETITIENGTVSVPRFGNVRMRASEIAAMLGVYEQTVSANIKAILKSGIAEADTSGPDVVEGNTLVPEFFGLDMVVAIAFRVHSPRAKLFREWVIRRITVGTESFAATLVVRLQDGELPN